MKKFLILLLLPALLASCSLPRSYSSDSAPAPTFPADEPSAPAAYVPVNYSDVRGLWIPYLRFEDLLQGKSEAEFRTAVKSLVNDAASRSINTLYFHAHPNGDAYYDSALFPKGSFLDGSYDPLSIVLDEAHNAGISVHAWLNPLRLQTPEQMDEIPDSFITKQWSLQPELHYVELVGGRWYLNPAYPEVRDLISNAAAEIVRNYPVDGIHIDDYFFPTTDPSFDQAAFTASGASDLAAWRRENVTRFVKGIYDAVKAENSSVLFGISPQGNINADYSSQYADVRLWGGTPGYCDYILPQIYFGFKNETMPFERTLRQWEELTAGSSVSLIIGLAAYKLGKNDQWAGASGENEWIDDPDIIQRQISLVQSSSADGYALYE